MEADPPPQPSEDGQRPVSSHTSWTLISQESTGLHCYAREAEHDVAEYGGRGTDKVPKSQTRLRFFVNHIIIACSGSVTKNSFQMLSLRT